MKVISERHSALCAVVRTLRKRRTLCWIVVAAIILPVLAQEGLRLTAPQRPNPTDFKTYDDYIEALVEWKVKTILPTLLHSSTAAAPSALPAPAGMCTPAIESHVEGDFRGWEGQTIYRLDNGQIWRQSTYHYHYHYAYHPAVVIYQTESGCHMRVTDDDDDGATVARIK